MNQGELYRFLQKSIKASKSREKLTGKRPLQILFQGLPRQSGKTSTLVKIAKARASKGEKVWLVTMNEAMARGLGIKHPNIRVFGVGSYDIMRVTEVPNLVLLDEFHFFPYTFKHEVVKGLQQQHGFDLIGLTSSNHA